MKIDAKLVELRAALETLGKSAEEVVAAAGRLRLLAREAEDAIALFGEELQTANQHIADALNKKVEADRLHAEATAALDTANNTQARADEALDHSTNFREEARRLRDEASERLAALKSKDTPRSGAA